MVANSFSAGSGGDGPRRVTGHEGKTHKRWIARAVRQDGRYRASPPELAGPPPTLLSRLRADARSGTPVGVDYKLRRHKNRTSELVAKLDVLVYPVADSLHPRPAKLSLAKEGPGDVRESIDVTVPAAQ